MTIEYARISAHDLAQLLHRRHLNARANTCASGRSLFLFTVVEGACCSGRTEKSCPFGEARKEETDIGRHLYV